MLHIFVDWMFIFLSAVSFFVGFYNIFCPVKLVLLTIIVCLTIFLDEHFYLHKYFSRFCGNLLLYRVGYYSLCYCSVRLSWWLLYVFIVVGVYCVRCCIMSRYLWLRIWSCAGWPYLIGPYLINTIQYNIVFVICGEGGGGIILLYFLYCINARVSAAIGITQYVFNIIFKTIFVWF